MIVTGLITEYNPFHNGHVYHLTQAKAMTGADRVICVMSGNFVQRGQPAIINKWARAQIALTAGADLVIELPAVFATASAEFFAYGAISLLDCLGITDFVCFGSEAGNTAVLEDIASVLADEPDMYKALLKEYLSTGVSFPAAREKALAAYMEKHGKACLNTAETLGQSNNILGVEYLKAIKKLKSRIKPVTLERISNAYNSSELTGAISSATAIRNLISGISENVNGDSLRSLYSLHSPNSPNSPATGRRDMSEAADMLTNELNKVMPGYAASVLMQEVNSGRGPVTLNSFENIIFARLRKADLCQIKELPYIAEGLENRLKTAADNSGSLSELLDKVCTKRYTKTRIQRSLISLLTGLKASELSTFMKHGGPRYVRVLGFNRQGRELLSHIKKTATLPVIIKTADFKASCNPLLVRMLEIEAEATDMYVLAYKNPLNRKGGQEYTANLLHDRAVTLPL